MYPEESGTIVGGTNEGVHMGTRAVVRICQSGGAVAIVLASFLYGVLPSGAAQSTTVTVGSDSQFTTALRSASSGSTIVVKDGTYRVGEINISKSLTIKAQNNRKAIFDGQKQKKFAFQFRGGSSNSLLQGLVIKNYKSTNNPSINPGAVLISTNNVQVLKNTISYNVGGGLVVYGKNVKVSENTIAYNGAGGIRAHTADGLQFSKNVVAYNNTGDFIYYGAQGSVAGIKLTKTNGANLSGNYFYRNNSTGLWVDMQSSSVTIDRNVSAENELHGIFYEISTKGTITNNVAVKNVGLGINMIGSNRSTINTNRVRNNQDIRHNGHYQMLVGDDARQCSNPNGSDCNSHNNTVNNNGAEVQIAGMPML